MFELTSGEGDPKMHRYGELLRRLFSDQLAWIQDAKYARRVDDKNGRDALAMAAEADRQASR